jgi:hypothetical protein
MQNKNHNIKTVNKSFENVGKVQQQQIKITFMKKLTDYNPGIFATIQLRIFCLPASYLKT